MKDNFINPEIKKSSFLLLLVISLFMGTSLIFMNIQYSNIKESYTQTIGAVAGKIVNQNPSMENEIIPLITKKISQNDADMGKAFLKDYGLDKKTENAVFPYIDSTAASINNFIIIIFIFLFITLFFLNYFEHSYFYNKVRIFTSAIKKIIEGDFSVSICEEKEGDISKLSSSLSSIKNIIRNNLGRLNSEKQFLVELLSDISHQLKTPLSSLILYNDIMLSKELTIDQKNTFLQNSKKQLERMKWLIMNLLKLARLDADSIKLNLENESLLDTIDEACEALSYRAQKMGVTVNILKDDDVIMNHDRLWLIEALTNIIKNCIEHTKNGGLITISLIDNPVFTKINITDNGEGISEDDLPNIFKRFYKAKTSKNSDSIGIGLALSKSIIELHGGLIEAFSTKGFGTSFIITFPKFNLGA